MKQTSLHSIGLTTLLLAGASLTAGLAPSTPYSLTILHNNDGESQLFAKKGIGGVAEFKTLFDDTRSFYESQGHGVVSVFAGDTYLAGPRFQASLDSGAPGSRTFYDALAISRIGYDASIIGNHEFDFGPSVLAEFIGDAQTTNPTKYLSSNLDFSSESSFNSLVTNGTVAKSTVVTVPTAAGNKSVGIIGATTENLSFISSPGAVGVSAVAAAVDAEVLALQGQGVDHIVLGSHLQGIAEDKNLVNNLSANSRAAINLIIAGGGDELLGNSSANSPTVPYGASAPASIVDTGIDSDDKSGIVGAYPNGETAIPIVTTADNYRYLGRVTLNFDASGNLVDVDNTSNPQLNTGMTPDAAVAGDIAPVQTYVDNLDNTIIGNTSVEFLHGGSPTIRSQETNVGNLVADAFLATAQDKAADFGLTLTPDRLISIANGGGIRAGIAAGDVSALDTFNVSPFGNFVAVIQGLTAGDLKLILENAYSRVIPSPTGPVRDGGGTGRFLQIGGFTVVYDISGTAMVLDGEGNLVTNGERILSVTLDDGTPIVVDGVVVSSETFDVALAAFVAAGGDQLFEDYLSQAYAFTNLRVTDQQSVLNLIESFNGADLAGTYGNPNGEGRITAVPEPAAAAALLGLVTALGLIVRRRRA